MAFGGFLRQSTAVDILIGPFVDEDDGKTAETGLTLAQADIKLSKNGQPLSQKNDDTTAVHDANGYYNCELNATDTNTCGQLTAIVHKSGALPVRHEYQVIEENIYDSLFAASAAGFDANQRVDLGKIMGELLSGNNAILKLKKLEIIGDDSSGDALLARSQQEGCAGIMANNNVNGPGFKAVGTGALGNGIFADATGPGHGIRVNAEGGDGVQINAAVGDALKLNAISGDKKDISAKEMDAILGDTNELQGLIADSKIAAQIKGTDDINLSAKQKADVVAAIKTMTGFTAGGTWTYQELIKAIAAYLLGTWQDKSGDPSVQEILDAEDDATVILEILASTTSPYKATTKK